MIDNSDNIKQCENCATPLTGEFCSNCGQKELDTNFSFLGLFKYLFVEFINWDNKVLKTFKNLLLKPGFLSKEYSLGKRADYMHPLRLYFFTSFFYFTLIFATSGGRTKDSETEKIKTHKNDSHKNNEATIVDAVKIKDSLANVTNGLKKDTIKRTIRFNDGQGNVGLQINTADLDSTSYLGLFFNKIENYPDGYVESKMLSYLPKFLFFILPFIALCLSLFYRRHKDIRFFHHFIYIAHNHSFLFALLFLDSALTFWIDDDGLANSILMFLEISYVNYYMFTSLKTYYAQFYGKTLVKFVLISCSYLFLTLISSFILLFLVYLLN